VFMGRHATSRASARVEGPIGLSAVSCQLSARRARCAVVRRASPTRSRGVRPALVSEVEDGPPGGRPREPIGLRSGGPRPSVVDLGNPGAVSGLRSARRVGRWPASETAVRPMDNGLTGAARM
jgi:hypothetical protein